MGRWIERTVSGVDELVAFLRAALDRDEQVALEASRFEHDERPLTPTGEHWQWVETENDRVVPIDPMTDGYVGESLDEFRVSLRSVEEYPTSESWTLPHFVIHTAEEVPAICGVHIARWDPARVLAKVKAERRILDDITRNDYIDGLGNASTDGLAHRLLGYLAQSYAGQPGWREEWGA
jgi:hypothetical protein